MAITSKWGQHIEAWQRSGLSQAEYCAEQQIDACTFTARLSDYRKLSATVSSALIPGQVEQAPSAAIVFTHAQGHRLAANVSIGAAGSGVIAMSGLIGYPSLIWLAVEPLDMRRGLDDLSVIVQHSWVHLLRRLGLYLPQSNGQSLALAAVGWQRRMARSAPFASGPFCLA